jgi:hypothetical protein
VRVEAIASKRQRGFAVEDTAAALIEFDDGALGTFFISDSAVSPWTMEQGLGEAPEFPFSGQSSYRLMGRRGALEFPGLVQWAQANDAQDWNKPIQAQHVHAARSIPMSRSSIISATSFGARRRRCSRSRMGRAA